MAISDNIREIQDKINNEFGSSNTPTGDELREKAVAAIFEGANSAEWNNYMQLFAKTDDELAKLMPEPNPNSDQEISDRNLARAYLVGNGNCGAESPSGAPLSFGIGTTLD
jgi:hypothetical protein